MRTEEKDLERKYRQKFKVTSSFWIYFRIHREGILLNEYIYIIEALWY